MQDKFDSHESVDAINFDPFSYLSSANNALSNPIEESKGRDMIIRALNKKEKFLDYEEILRGLVRKSGLFPYLFSEFENRTFDEDMLVSLYQSEFSNGFIFHSMQQKIFNMVMARRNVVLSAPTSMGKSAIIDAILASGKFKRVVLVVPTIALIDETRRRIANIKNLNYDVIHHNSQRTRSYKKTVYILTQERVNERTDLELIDFFVIDEFYKLSFKDGNDERAISLNIALSKLLVNSKQFYMIGPSIDEIRGLGTFNRPYFFIPSSFSTVAVNVHEYNIASNDKDKKNIALKSILDNGGNLNYQTMIYCRSPQSAGEVSRALIAMGFGENFESDYVDWIEKYYGEDWSYSKALSRGIGIHHGALPRAIQQHTIDLFNEKKLSILICTSTIIEGVNTNAQTVVIYDGRNGSISLDRFTHNNIKGRAGRMKVHFVGEVHCLEKVPEETLESRVVDIPLGMQDESSPLNFLAGIQSEHVSRDVVEAFDKYLDESILPAWLLRKHSSLSLAQLKILYDAINLKSREEIKVICKQGYPTNECLELLCFSLKKIARRSLQNVSLHFDESLELNNKLKGYLFSRSYQEYMDKFLEWLGETDHNSVAKSNLIDRELRIIRNIFGYSVPKTLLVLQDVLNIICDERDYIFSANFGLAAAIFENNHLTPNFSALEEMGVPIQTLEKIRNERFENTSLNVLIRFLRGNLRAVRGISILDKKFLARAVGLDKL